MEEQWKEIAGWEGLYAVSDRGRVRSLERVVPCMRRGVMTSTKIQGRIRKLSPHKSGHLLVTLRRFRFAQTRYVHQLVLEAFVGPCPPWHEALHRNGDPADNRLENLSWGTRKQNVADTLRHGRHHWANKTHCKNGHPLSGDNMRLERGGKTRRCRACAKQAVERFKARQGT